VEAFSPLTGVRGVFLSVRLLCEKFACVRLGNGRDKIMSVLKNKKRLLVIVVLLLAFIYSEFFLFGTQVHQEYVRETLTKEQAIKECPNVEISASDEVWMREVLDSVVDRNCLDGEYTSEELELLPHPEYEVTRVEIKVSSSQTGWGAEEKEYHKYVAVSFNDVMAESGTVNISMSAYGTPDAFGSKRYDELSFSKSVEYFKDSIFEKELPDIQYSFHGSENEYSKLYLKHEWFAIIRDVFNFMRYAT
jgi:hypothetical protein